MEVARGQRDWMRGEIEAPNGRGKIWGEKSVGVYLSWAGEGGGAGDDALSKEKQRFLADRPELGE